MNPNLLPSVAGGRVLSQLLHTPCQGRLCAPADLNFPAQLRALHKPRRVV